jgi:putative flippase GtrA
MSRPHNSALKGQLLRFLVNGLASVAIDACVYSLLLGANLARPFAKGASYLSGMLFGFFGNKYWTFSTRKVSASEPIAYGLVYALTFAQNITTNSLILSWTGSPAIAFLTATGLSTVLNFIGLKWIVFRSTAAQPDPHMVPAHTRLDASPADVDVRARRAA